MEEEREKVRGQTEEEADVEAHRRKAYGEGSEPPKEEAGRRASDEDEPDVEAHRHKG